jgi:hypothetical protein
VPPQAVDTALTTMTATSEAIQADARRAWLRFIWVNPIA